VEEVENQLRGEHLAEVPSRVVGEMVMERLREIDEIAYVRFASVYRSFKDVAEMRAEIEDFLAHPSTTRRLPGRRPRPGRTEGQNWLSTWASDRPPSPAGSGVHDLGSMVPLPAPLLADLAGSDEVLVTSRAGAGMGTVRMSFAIASPGSSTS